MFNYYNNFIKYDYFDKLVSLDKKSCINNKLSVLIKLHLKFIKRENDARILDTLKFLEVVTGNKFFIKKFSFFFSKNFRSKYSEVLICVFIRKEDIFILIKYLNIYFLNFYRKYISKKIQWHIENLAVIHTLNKLFHFNNNFKKKDICVLCFYGFPYHNGVITNFPGTSFLIDKH